MSAIAGAADQAVGRLDEGALASSVRPPARSGSTRTESVPLWTLTTVLGLAICTVAWLVAGTRHPCAVQTGRAADEAWVQSQRRTWPFFVMQAVVLAAGAVALIVVMSHGSSPAEVAIVCLGSAALVLLVAATQVRVAEDLEREARRRRLASSPSSLCPSPRVVFLDR